MSDFLEKVDLASERLGGSVLYATDDYFAEKENLIRQAQPVWKEHEYTDRGKWMDGWESRRKRDTGHDFAIIRLGAPGVIRGAVVDTSFFRGNFPSHCSIEGTTAGIEDDLPTLLDGGQTPSPVGPVWTEILPKAELKGDSQNSFAIDSPLAFSHLRFHIYPDGGVARLRVHGDVIPEWARAGGLTNEIDLAAIEHGGEVLTCSDMFFGPKHNLIMPGRAHNMSDGWETRRRRGPGHDWVIVRLATEGVIRRIEIDTNHFKGNFPDTASIESSNDGTTWRELLPRRKLQAHTRHMFIDELISNEPSTHLRLNVYPDGGVSRLRAFGTATEKGRGDAAATRINTRSEQEAARELTSCCGSASWVQRMVEKRPFDGWGELSSTADKIWTSLSEKDWLEAFMAHPRIGEQRSGARFSSAEQAGVARSSSDARAKLVEINRKYEEKFGHIYLVCATGMDADQLLAIAQRRMSNDPSAEIREAAEEQRKITRLRLLKLVS